MKNNFDPNNRRTVVTPDMASSKFVPPEFIDDTSQYDEYKRKLLRWSRITKHDPKQQAEVVLYHLQGHPSGIQEKIDTALGDEVIDNDDAMKKLVEYLDSIYAEDEMTNMWTKYKKFVRLKKSLNQPITEFIAEFERAYKEAKDNGCEVSDTVLALNLLESCNLSDTDEKFVLTAVDFKVGKEKKDCLEQVKRSLRKFQSREKLSSDRDRFEVKEEDTFVASIQEALIADGWRPPAGVSVPQNSSAYKGTKNRLGEDGKPIRCFHCESEHHLSFQCDKKKKPEEVGSSSKTTGSATNATSKKKKKVTATKKKNTEEQSMLPKLLKESNFELSMVCEVQEEAQTEDEVEETVLVSRDEKELCCLVDEAGSRGVLDSACSRSVAGVGWIRKYTDAISPNLSDSLTLTPSSKVYQFGGGEKRRSKGTIKLPTLIGDKKVFITIDVVNALIPLLIGSNAMEAASAVLDFKKKEATFFNQVVPMTKVGSGHYCINLLSEHLITHIADVVERDCKVKEVLVSADKVKVSDLKRLHHYYGHTSVEKLLKFLRKAGKDNDNLKSQLGEIEKSCESCTRSKRRKPRPSSAIPRVEGPNEIVSIDLKEWSTSTGKKKYICYLIDMHSRLTSGSFISDKKPDTIVNCIMKHWIPVFGVMRGIHSDIGGELSNTIVDDVAHKLGVELTTTAAYSPHQNGVNERNHAVVDLMVTLLLASDKNLSPENALLWALNTKNSMKSHFGFLPFQLHIGRNPVLPSATRDGPPAYENTSVSRSFVSHMNAMMSARDQFIKAEASFSLKKALKSRIYPRGQDIEEGDLIYYKKNAGKGKNVLWSGPSKVTSVNGKKLFIDQGARLGTVNRDDAVKVGEEFWRMDELSEPNSLEGCDAEKIEKKEGKLSVQQELLREKIVESKINKEDEGRRLRPRNVERKVENKNRRTAQHKVCGRLLVESSSSESETETEETEDDEEDEEENEDEDEEHDTENGSDNESEEDGEEEEDEGEVEIADDREGESEDDERDDERSNETENETDEVTENEREYDTQNEREEEPELEVPNETREGVLEGKARYVKEQKIF